MNEKQKWLVKTKKENENMIIEHMVIDDFEEEWLDDYPELNNIITKNEGEALFVKMIDCAEFATWKKNNQDRIRKKMQKLYDRMNDVFSTNKII